MNKNKNSNILVSVGKLFMNKCIDKFTYVNFATNVLSICIVIL